MRQIVVDYFWRKSWIILPILLYELFVVREFGTAARHDEFIVLLLPLYIGPLLLENDLQRGFTRALMALPVTARQIGRAWWLSAVGVPALLLMATTGLSAIVPLEGGQSRLLFSNCLVQVLSLGAMFGLLTFMPASYRGGGLEKARGWLLGGLWIFLFGGGIVLFRDFSWSNPLKAEVVMAVGAVLTVVGWFRAEGMVLQRGALRPGAQATTSKSVQYKAPAGFGGMPYLWRSLLIPLGWFGLAFVGWLVLSGMYQGRSLRFPPQLVEVNVIPFVFMSIIPVYTLVFISLVTQLRFLRTLPISASILAATLVLIPIGSISFGVCVLAATVHGEGDLIVGSLLAAAGVAAFVPVVVWRGLGTATPFPASLVILVSIIMFPACIKLADGPPLVAVSFSVIVIFLSWEITRRVLRSSSQAYRVDPLVIRDGGGMRWS